MRLRRRLRAERGILRRFGLVNYLAFIPSRWALRARRRP